MIEALQKNGREPFRRIAADVGVSEATIRARYQRLCDDNILQVTGVTNPLGLGFDAQAMVGIRTGGAPEPVADAIARWDEVDYVVITAGQFDILVEVVCADRRQLLDLTNRIRALEGVVSTESFLYLELWKQLYDWGARLQDGERVRVQLVAVESTEQREEMPARKVDVDVRLDRVTKTFDDVVAVDGISLEIDHGSFFALLGPSGLWEDHDAADDRRLRGAHLGHDLPRRRAGHREAAVQARRQHGLPVVRALPAPHDLRERCVRPAAARHSRAGTSRAA